MTSTLTVHSGYEYVLFTYQDPLGASVLEARSRDGWELVTILRKERNGLVEYTHYFRKPKKKQVTVYDTPAEKQAQEDNW